MKKEKEESSDELVNVFMLISILRVLGHFHNINISENLKQLHSAALLKLSSVTKSIFKKC